MHSDSNISELGIVTRYDLYTVPISNIWYEVLIISNDQMPGLLDAFAAWQNGGAADLKSTIAVTGGLQTAVVGFVYTESAPRRPAAFAEFDNLTPLAVAVPPTNGTMVTLTALVSAVVPNTQERQVAPSNCAYASAC